MELISKPKRPPPMVPKAAKTDSPALPSARHSSHSSPSSSPSSFSPSLFSSSLGWRWWNAHRQRTIYVVDGIHGCRYVHAGLRRIRTLSIRPGEGCRMLPMRFSGARGGGMEGRFFHDEGGTSSHTLCAPPDKATTNPSPSPHGVI